MSSNSDDAVTAFFWLGIFIVAILYWIVTIIIEYFAIFFFLSIFIGIIWYYSANAPVWEKEKKMKDSFINKNQKNHSNFVKWYKATETNIKILEMSFLNKFCEDRFKHINKKLLSLKIFLKPPEYFFDKRKSTTHNPYGKAYTEIVDIIESTTEIPMAIEALRKKYNNLKSKDIVSHQLEGFNELLLSLSINFNDRDTLIFKVDDSCMISYFEPGKESPNHTSSLDSAVTN